VSGHDDLPGSRPSDDWDNVELNEDFVAGARRNEAPADERIERANRVNAGHADLERQGAISPYATLKKPRFGWFHRRRRWLLPLLILLALALVLWAIPVVNRWVGASADSTSWPPAGVGEHPTRLHPVVEANGSTSFAYEHLQIDGIRPVTYDPCRVINYVINPADEPAGADALIKAAFLTVQKATGLQFSYQGTTSEKFSVRRPAFQPWRYGDRWAPVLVTWSQPTRDSRLKGDVVGDAGSAWVSLADGSRYYISGEVSLAGGKLGSLLHQPNGPAIVEAVLLHELGHLVGLGHTTDSSQLMYPSTSGQLTHYAIGDLAGLASLGAGRCSASF